MRKRQFMFRLFYSTTFTVILIIEILLLLISPGDIIYQSFAANRTLSIIAVAIVYVAFLVIASFIIATRFYTAHTQLTAIPKDHVPIRKDELTNSIFKLITPELARTASIAYHAHPREVHQEDIDLLDEETTRTKARTITWSLDHVKSWKEIQHAGWSSPCKSELACLQFEPVLLEFAHLIEAKAVSMAPTDPLMNSGVPDYHGNVVADIASVELLQRPVSMSLRQYLERLAELEMMDMDDNTNDFLGHYEKSRFLDQPISDEEFQSLLDKFTRFMAKLQAPTVQAFDRFREQKVSLSTSSSRSVLRKPSTESYLQRPAKGGPGLMSQEGSTLARDNEFKTPLNRSLTPFMTPKRHLYQSSLSSGHAGDRSSDSDSENEHSVYTAYTRPRRHTRTTNTSRYASAAASVGRGSAFPSGPAEDGEDNTDSAAANVVQRTTLNTSNQSLDSLYGSVSEGSVIHHEDQAAAVLPLPLVVREESEFNAGSI